MHGNECARAHVDVMTRCEGRGTYLTQPSQVPSPSPLPILGLAACPRRRVVRLFGKVSGIGRVLDNSYGSARACLGPWPEIRTGGPHGRITTPALPQPASQPSRIHGLVREDGGEEAPAVRRQEHPEPSFPFWPPILLSITLPQPSTSSLAIVCLLVRTYLTAPACPALNYA